MGQSLIDLVNISKSFDGTMVLDDLSLSVKENTFVTLLGPSGCGKTTTLRIIGGFETADKGQVIFDGQDIGKIPPNKRQLNTVFQKYALFPHMNIAENIAFGLKIKNKPKAYIDDKIKYALKLVNLDGFEKRSVDSLSGGQQQRIAIARAILKDAPIVILDEATAFTDPENEDKIQSSIMALSKGKTLLVIAHRLSTIQNADQIVVLEKGSVADCGTQEELLGRCPLYQTLWTAHVGARNWAVTSGKKEGN